MMKNISISTFINIVFSLAFVFLFITFLMFMNYDKEKYELSLQNRYELIAENFLIVFQNQPTVNSLLNLYDKFKVSPIEKRDAKLKIIQNAQELTITQNYLGTYRVYKYDDNYYIYVQQYGYNIMLQDMRKHSYSMAVIIIGFIISIFIFLFLYEVIKRKLKPLKILNSQIKDFSSGNRDIKIDFKSTDEIGTIAKSFHDALNIINNQAKSKDLFMRNMMHELKTPITKAMFIAESIEDETKKQSLQKAFKRMDDIIKELATVEKLTSQKKMIYKEETRFFNIYSKTIDLMMIQPQNISSKINDFSFEVDIYMFSIALKNLIDNAIKFSPNKKAIIDANKQRIIISSQGEALKYDLNHYTEAFCQEEKRSEGFGLGLYIVKTIVNLHGFKFKYKYEENKNFFIIEL